ncbi:hypothetical protein MesoLj131b_38160 [Mesorhizobium sp. 131-2-5]|nr:hypothetical protein MesoLj131b_38160 [Mesorhizobium sp. 131-2-5]
MRRPIPLPENDNGTPEDHLVAATIALHKAVKVLDDPAKVIADALAVPHKPITI